MKGLSKLFQTKVKMFRFSVKGLSKLFWTKVKIFSFLCDEAKQIVSD